VGLVTGMFGTYICGIVSYSHRLQWYYSEICLDASETSIMFNVDSGFLRIDLFQSIKTKYSTYGKNNLIFGGCYYRTFFLPSTTICHSPKGFLPDGQPQGIRWDQLKLPIWLLFILFSIYPTIAFISGPLRRYRRRRKGLCIHCGYNLTGNTTGVCSECGVGICRK